MHLAVIARVSLLPSLAVLLVACEPPLETPPPVSSCPAEPGNICTFAGTGIAGLGAEELAPGETDLYLPMDVTFGPDGNAYVLDWNNHRVRVMADGVMRTLIGSGRLGEAPEGPALESSLNHPTNVTFAPNGDLVLAAWHNSKIMRYDSANQEILRVSGNGQRSFSGDGGPAADAVFDLPVATAFAPDGSLYIADQANQRVRKVGVDGVINTVVGTGQQGFGGDEGPAVAAQLDLPTGQMAPPTGRIATDDEGNLFIVDTGNDRIRKVTTDGLIHTVAGNGESEYGGDGGLATEAAVNHPNDVEPDGSGGFYIADTNNSCVRHVDADGLITTAAGVCGERGSDGDGGAATGALLDRPYGVAIDGAGNLYIADTHNHLLRVVYR